MTRSPHGPRRREWIDRVRLVALALALLAGVLTVPSLGWLGDESVARASGPRILPQGVTTLDAPCTRIIDGTEWVLDPCVPEGEPLPPDIVEQIEQVRRERECQSTTPTSPTTTVPTEPTTGPTTTGPTLTEPTWTDTTVRPTWTETVLPPGIEAVPPIVTATDTVTNTVVEPTPTTAPTLTGTDTTVPSPTGTTTSAPTTTSWTCPPPDPSPTGPTSTTTTEPTDPTTTQPPPTTEPPPTGCDATAPPPDLESRIREARHDRIECRDPNRIPDPGGATVLVATGDSVTSAHHQWGFGSGVCDRTSADFRRLTGNHANFSYAGRYFGLDPNVIEYYNFARTGFGTPDMLAAPANKPDACNNAWGRAFAPVPLADAVVRKAKADGRKAYFVTTGGVNNTNWTTVLKQLIKCRGLEFAQQTVIPRSSINWAAVGGRGGIVTNGGSCVLRVRGNAWLQIPDYFQRIAVPAYDGPARAAGITRDTTAIVNTMLAAGADKIVWMLYYDINPANIDLANFGHTLIRDTAPARIAALLPPRVAPTPQPLVDPMWVGAVRALINNLNAAIVAGIPANAKVRAQPAPVFGAADIQDTALGGSPHPSAAGHTKLANALLAAYRAL